MLMMDADNLSMLPYDVIDRLALRVNERLKVHYTRPPNDSVAFNEKLAHLRRLATTQGRPVC